jgi:secreted PhoX family phosphatase
MRKRTLLVSLLVFGAVSAAAIAAGTTVTGPSSTQPPYVIPSQDGVKTVSLLTVGDSVDGYRLVGIPDGLGAYESRPGTFTVLLNHELGQTQGVVRDHGATGAFVSRWVIEEDGLAVASGRDHVVRVATWNSVTSTFNPPGKGVALGRLCSANLAPQSAFYDKRSKTGYKPPLFLSGEEVGNEGRAFAHAEGGISWVLPSLGKFSWENAVANPATGRKTVVVGTDDSTPGQVYVYVGEKQATGNPAERAGLTGGRLFGIKVPGVALEPVNTGVASGTAFTAADLGDVKNLTGAQIEAASDAAGVTEWNRPEDASWDPEHPNDLYFAITASFTTQSKLYRLRFSDPANPSAGGKVDQLLTGLETGGTPERFHMLDNITVDGRGNVLLQEDPGGQEYLARIWQYAIKDDSLTELATFDPARFTTGKPGFITNDEESSGIIDAEKILGRGWYLFDAQVHKANPDPELVEHGQLLALFVPSKGRGDDHDDDDDEDEDH